MKFRLLTGVLVAMQLMTLPALAHDELVEQSPRSNEVVSAGIVTITLTFSDNLLALADGSGSEIVILNSEGVPMNNGCAVVEGNVATAAASIAQPGVYQVGWRAVSSDGHPISESFRFEVQNTTGYEVDQGFVFAECANPYNPQTSEIEFQSSEFFYWLLWGSLGLVALGLFFWLRPKRPIGDSDRG
jgi:methionine-rich copper-binding protein CopC